MRAYILNIFHLVLAPTPQILKGCALQHQHHLYFPDLTARILSPERNYLLRIIDVLLLSSPGCSNTIQNKDTIPTPPNTKHKKILFIFISPILNSI